MNEWLASFQELLAKERIHSERMNQNHPQPWTCTHDSPKMISIRDANGVLVGEILAAPNAMLRALDIHRKISGQ